MPFSNEHSCRIKNPDLFEQNSFRRIKEGRLSIIIGKLKGQDKTTTQAYRYSTEDWTEEEAKKNCEKYGGEFHPAKK
jgi:hypothetical protein